MLHLLFLLVVSRRHTSVGGVEGIPIRLQGTLLRLFCLLDAPLCGTDVVPRFPLCLGLFCELCLDVCLAELENPNHQEDGSLNPCIQCDEDESGPVFKAVSGRTRRNSGLPSALCRPCDSIYRVDHDYGFSDLNGG